MTQYTDRITVAAPEGLIPEANQLALHLGESEADAQTFRSADWQDESGNKYAVCSFVAKPVVAASLSKGLPDFDSGADLTMVEKAFSKITLYQEGVTVGADKIVLAINSEPTVAIEGMGLSVLEDGQYA